MDGVELGCGLVSILNMIIENGGDMNFYVVPDRTDLIWKLKYLNLLVHDL